MNKLEKVYLDLIEKNNWGETEHAGLHTYENEKSFTEINAQVVSTKIAEVTTDVAIKFLEWYETSEWVSDYLRKNRVYPTMDGSHHLIVEKQRRELLEIFINGHYVSK